MKRVVAPELLDGLAASDPEARRSRRDLRIINRLMGNFRWLRKAVRGFRKARVVEIGAGDGGLLEKLGEEVAERVGVDLAPRPDGIDEGVEWVEGDVFEVLGEVLGREAVVVANLFLHHFEDARLRELGGMLRDCEAICVSEPLRSRLALAEGGALWPLVNRVTRHDIMVSIRAGFRRGELPALLGLDSGEWEVREQCTLLGACRVLAWKK